MQAESECLTQTAPQEIHRMLLSDAELVEEIRAGNRQAFRMLYDRYAPKMFRLACRYHGNSADAEDAIQESFLNAYRSIGSFRGGSQVATWLYRITVNACISIKRKNRRYVPGLESWWDAIPTEDEHPVHDPRIVRIIQQELLELRDTHRMVFLLYAVEGLTHSEIAETLGTTENTSKSHYRRARQSLIKRLARHGITEEELI